MSGDWRASVGRLRARAPNCSKAVRFSLSPSAAVALRVRSVSCVAYQQNGISGFGFPRPPCALPGAGWTRGELRVPGVPRAQTLGRLGPRSLCPFSRMRNAAHGREVSAPIVQATRIVS